MAQRSIAADLARVFAAAPPVYVLDDAGRIQFANDACGAWADCAPADLIGLECRYHDSAEMIGAAAIALALAPPPEVWAGQRATAVVTLAQPGGETVTRRVEFLPLGSDAIDMAGVLAVASPHVETAASGRTNEASSAEPTPRDLHRLLAEWRRRLGRQFHLDRLLGDNPAVRQARQQVEVAAATAASVTIVGPPGCGRQHAARAIHYGRHPQSAGPLVPLACPLLALNVLEPTIRTLVRRADEGQTDRPATLLLSDVEQLSAEAQEYLLTVLSGRSTFRVVSTSRAPLAALTARGEFRPELACALSTIEIRLPPLAERMEDLPLIAQMLVEQQNGRAARQIGGLTPEALDRLAVYSWPGNIVELAEVITAAHAQTEGPHITPGDLPAKIQLAVDAVAHVRKTEQPIVLEQFLARIEIELIQRALKRARGNKTKAARLLGMTRPRLYRRLVQLGLEDAKESP